MGPTEAEAGTKACLLRVSEERGAHQVGRPSVLVFREPCFCSDETLSLREAFWAPLPTASALALLLLLLLVLNTSHCPLFVPTSAEPHGDCQISWEGTLGEQ